MATDATQRANQRQRRSDGERSHETILRAAAQLATVEGIDGLSLGRLAEHIGMSKSGLFAHFGSKEELQLATVEKAQEVFTSEVVAPALVESDGLRRVEALGERFLSHVEREVFAGGCFFASVSAEVDTRPGAVHELIVAVQHGWWEMIESGVKAAQESGELDRGADSRQLTFELNAMLTQGNASWLIFRDRSAFELARRGFAGLLESARPR